MFDKKINWLQWLIYHLRYDLSLADYVRYSTYLQDGDTMSYFLAGAIESGTAEGETVLNTALDIIYDRDDIEGVDPEASHSTVKMRRVLVSETANLLGVKNYELKKNHVLIQGEIGNYSIHLGSGVVHRQPGGYVSIIPVHGQHRGGLFLPFVDDDPKSAEILSKVLLLAEDNKIKDPTILKNLVEL